MTPQGFVWFRERLWLLTPRNSFKAKVLAKRPDVGVLLEDDGSHLYIGGRTQVLDPLDPSSLGADALLSALLPAAFAAYLKKNVYESIAAARRRFGMDVLGMPVTRVALVVRPERWALLGPKGPIGDGDWSGGSDEELKEPANEAADLDELPEGFLDMAVAGQHLAVVGWGGSGAPLLMPGRWDGDEQKAEVDAALLDLAMAPSAAEASVTLDNEVGPDLEAKRGVVLRGPGVAEFSGGKASITLDATKVHLWEGTKVGSISGDPIE